MYYPCGDGYPRRIANLKTYCQSLSCFPLKDFCCILHLCILDKGTEECTSVLISTIFVSIMNDNQPIIDNKSLRDSKAPEQFFIEETAKKRKITTMEQSITQEKQACPPCLGGFY